MCVWEWSGTVRNVQEWSGTFESASECLGMVENAWGALPGFCHAQLSLEGLFCPLSVASTADPCLSQIFLLGCPFPGAGAFFFPWPDPSFPQV